jgi:hypothetical protein
VSEVGLRKEETRGHTEFDGIRGEMISDWVLAISLFRVIKGEERLTLMTLNSFSEPLTPLILSLWSSWTNISEIRAKRGY